MEASRVTRSSHRASGTVSGVVRRVVGRCPGGEAVEECLLTNSRGTEAAILTLGATLRTLLVSDASGNRSDVVLGFDTVAEYLSGGDYFGATVGRYANRIARGRFSIGAANHRLELNAPPNAEHGGSDGFHRRLWNVESIGPRHGTSLTLSLTSPDGDQGYPGRLEVQVTYGLTEDDELRIEYRARTSRPTVINLTNHSYWALSGDGGATEGLLRIDADAYTPIDSTFIPTGEIAPVEGTPFDFRVPRPISSRIRDGSCRQLAIGRGYDHNFVLRPSGGAIRPVARLEDLRSGRALDVLTTEPGLQLYTGNFLNGTVSGKSRRLYRQGDGIALETQHFPDSPNHPKFPTTLLEPGQDWSSATTYRFSTLPDAAAGLRST